MNPQANTQPDEKDLRLLELLEVDSKRTIKELSRLSGMRPSTVHHRITRLVDNGVIERFTIRVSDEKVGNRLLVFMLISGSLEKYIDEAFRNHPNVVEVHGITGEYDLLMKLKFRDMKEFNRFIIHFRNKYSDSIHKTITMVQTVRLK